MAALAASIADTIAGMQKVLNRDQYTSDSDEPYLQPSNHGHKLKRKAQFISNGPDGRINGPKAYRKVWDITHTSNVQTIKHAGYSRDIIRRNPRRYDEDGNELATDEEDEEADARAAEENPYSGIRLESLLMPLTSAAALPDHPSMSFPYLSAPLGDMAQHACEIVQRERKTLCNAKRMLTKLRGDQTWIPCGMVETKYDNQIFDTGKIYETIISTVPTNGATGRRAARLNGVNQDSNGQDHIPEAEQGNAGVVDVKNSDGDLDRRIDANETPPPITKGTPNAPKDDEDSFEDGIVTNGAVQGPVKPEETSITTSLDEDEGVDMVAETTEAPAYEPVMQNGNREPHQQLPLDLAAEVDAILPSVEDNNADGGSGQIIEGIVNQKAENDDKVKESSQSPPRRITRAQAQADKISASTHSSSPEDWVPPPLHPLFLIPPSAKPDPDFGLPPDEADETRRMLAAYVQKQGEVCRGAEKLHEGLLLANRQRKTVINWCKAEGHVGDMSDGEDWYDKEEWGLEEELRKGHVEEEEDATVVQGKKTRGRRA
ncbi:MAG: hypothetical protein Q9164_003739 [Protoblastenia rupestris]